MSAVATLYASPAYLHERMMRRVTKPRGGRGCWIFNGAINSRGYGCVGAGKKSKTVLAHRLVVIVRDGGIPDDMTVDHLCCVKRCVNPAHLEVVTRGENSRRGNRSWIKSSERAA